MELLSSNIRGRAYAQSRTGADSSIGADSRGSINKESEQDAGIRAEEGEIPTPESIPEPE